MTDDGADGRVDPTAVGRTDGRGDALVGECGSRAPERRPARNVGEDAANDRAGGGVNVVAGPVGAVGVAVQRLAAREDGAGLDAGALPADRPLADLLVLDLRRVAADEADQLPFGTVVERL